MSAEFIHDLHAPYGEAEPVSPLITRVLCENPSPFTYTGTGTYVVGTGPNVAVIDPGPMMEAHGKAILESTKGKTISHILVTHSHIDHSPLSAWLSERTGAPIYAFGPHGAGRKGGLEGEEVEAGADHAFQPHHQLKDGDRVTGDGWTLRAIHTPGHTANHLCFMLEEEQALFCGDHIMGWATTVISPPDGDMRAYLKSLRRTIDEKPARLLPTHGPAVEDPEPFVRGIITHRRMREGQILKHLEDGPLSIDIMVSRMYKDVNKALHPAAARSVLGHLIALVEEGRVEADGPATLVSEYRLPPKPCQ
ncbi:MULTISPECIES: MBL fold metallo-hydrolase [Kordiimonas]|jgi:glyoxylase-like metal-dependent hydrolase (beta-lactamase superfamily II)|uniref:MBL fold metallo-hydrolase n=1 Tax=Kordiimonas TaxID=288021 RepID=UPI002579C61C|nr:MBL fold metallo-hydrolase [Kordiimonas sp. UBA4487]